MMEWVFDDPSRFRTMTSCPDTVIADDLSYVAGRFPTPNLFWYWQKDGLLSAHGLDDRPSRYCYNIGTWIGPDYWAGFDGNEWGFKNLFELIPDVVLDDARRMRALLIVDSLNEAFQTDDLFRFWHQSCERYNLPPRCIAYLTSNELEKPAYMSWADRNGIKDTINVIGFAHLEYSQNACLTTTYPMLTWDDHLKHKNNNRRMRDFNCLNRVSRWHREYLILRMIESDLHVNALISQNKINLDGWLNAGIEQSVIDKARPILPLIADDPDFDHNKAMHINLDIYLNSWISVVTETNAEDNPDCLFISEKIWKPIYALHPFMVLGNQGTLASLHEMGYKTFDGILDESYDHRPFNQRVTTIIGNLHRLKVIKDKIGWLEQCREICLHNRENFIKRRFFDSQACRDILSAYDGLSK